jgi:hypothetical protein
MSKNFTHPRTGKLCFQLEHTNVDRRGLKMHYELLNLDENQVESRGLVEINETFWSYHEFINIAKLKAGNYQLTLKNISTSANILFVGLCPGMLYFE